MPRSPFYLNHMAFSCGIVLSDIDIQCDKTLGGLKKVVLCRQGDVSIITDPYDESIVLSVDTLNPSFISFNTKDGVTSFSESKTNTNGLGLISTTITVQVTSLNSSLNKIDMMGVINDIVAVCLHNNDTVTITGVMDGMVMTYEADSGSAISDKSYINITLSCESAIGSVVVDDTSVFTDKTIFN
jgi:hypothetical protein